MKGQVLFFAGTMLWANSVFASIAPTCQRGTLQDYINLGAGGCQIGETILADFTIEPGQASALPIDPANIEIVPFQDPDLLFLGGPGSGAAAGPGVLRDLLFRFRADALSGFLFSGAMAGITGFGVGGPGSVLSQEVDLCAGGSFADSLPSGCSGTPARLFDSVGTPPPPLPGPNTISVSFPATNSLAAFVDLRLEGPSQGVAIAFGSSVVDLPTAVPEPSMALCIVAGLGGMLSGRRFRHRRTNFRGL